MASFQQRPLKFRARALSANGEDHYMLSPEQVALDFDMHNRDEDTVLMQFTGLKDKNGVDIYEGDILNIEWQSRIGIVEFVLGSFVLKQGSEVTPLDKLVRNKWFIKVIGNIYQNPDLLEAKSE